MQVNSVLLTKIGDFSEAPIHQNQLLLGLCPGPAGGAYSTPRPWLVMRGLGAGLLPLQKNPSSLSALHASGFGPQLERTLGLREPPPVNSHHFNYWRLLLTIVRLCGNVRENN